MLTLIELRMWLLSSLGAMCIQVIFDLFHLALCLL